MEEIRKFISEFSGVRLESITATSSLADDLGIAGADGEELIRAFGRHFHVDVSRFKSADYFGPEGGADIFLLFSRRRRTLKPLIVVDLQQAIESGFLEEKT